jgi:rhodanese-related sulfurtransferase
MCVTFLWVLAALLAGCLEGDARLLEPQAARELMVDNAGQSDFLILDVRTPEEFRQGYIAGAVLLDYRAPDFRERFAELDRAATIFLYCRSGNRSSHVLVLADTLGFGRVYDLRGGIRAWTQAGLPLARDGAESKTSSGPPPS